MMCIGKAGEVVPPPIENADRTYQFWVKNALGKEQLCPLLTSTSLGPNADPTFGWTDEFVKECQQQEHMDINCDFLSTVPPVWFLHILATVTFPYLASTAMNLSKGTLAVKTARNLARGRDAARIEKVSILFSLRSQC
jgi:hypothetical protein